MEASSIEHRVPRLWTAPAVDGKDAPDLTAIERERVEEIIAFSRLPANADRMNFDNIVTAASMQKYLGYTIPNNKTMLNRRGNKKKKNQEKAASAKNFVDPNPSTRVSLGREKGKLPIMPRTLAQQ